MEGDISERLERFNKEVAETLVTYGRGSAARLAERYGVMQEYIDFALPEIYLECSLVMSLAPAGCTEEQMASCLWHIKMMKRGIVAYMTEQKGLSNDTESEATNE